MARQRKLKQADKAKMNNANTDDIPDEEKWRIIEQTGLLKQIPKDSGDTSNGHAKDGVEEDEDADICSPFCEEMFNTILYLIPFTSLYLMMELLAHRQYAQTITAAILLEKALFGVPFLYICIFNTLRYKKLRSTQALLFFVSVASGCRLIYVINWESWRVVIKQCAPLGTVWVLTVAMMDLLPAVSALGLVAGFVYLKSLRIVFD